MKFETKRFSSKLYEQYDNAKHDIINFYKKNGKNAIVNPKKYDIDLIVDDAFYCEVEVKNNWQGEKFQYDTLQIPYRKAKYTKLDKPSYFAVLNKERTHAFFVKGEDVANSPFIEVPNRFKKDKEFFFQIPVDKLTLVEL